MKEQEAIKLHIAENIHRIEVIEDFLRTNSDANDKECRKNIDILTKINKALEEVQQYLAIGTPEECRAAVEKQKTKKPLEQSCEEKTLFKCNNCGYIMKIKYSDGTVFGHSPNYCEQCGQKMDWSKNDKGRS